MIRTTFEYRIEPEEEQRLRLDTTLEVCRHLYNNCLSQRRESWKFEQMGLSYADQCRMLPTHKSLAEPIRKVHSQVLQQTLKRLDRAFENFFRRCKEHATQKGYSRFKSESRFHSFVFPQWGNGVGIVNDRLFLSK